MLEGTALGPYQILDELGRGGMGVVYRAVDPRSGQEVAVKVLTSQRAGARFEREVGSLARVQHSNVVPVLDCGQYLEHPWVAMAFVPGLTLQQRLDQRGPVTPGLAVSWIAKLARALAAVHEAGVVHRDVKPDNVILTPTGEPVLTDFGLALDSTATERLSMDGATLGSPGYFSPEQAVGDLQRIDARSDVYGLGATLYALLTGRPPIPPKGSLVEVIVATQEQKPEPPSSWNQRVDSRLDALCMYCLAKKPTQRPATAIALALALERYLQEGAVKRRRRMPRVGLFLLGPALALGAVAYAVSVFTAEGDPHASQVEAGQLADAEAELDALNEAYEEERYQEVINVLESFGADERASPGLLALLIRCYGQLERNELGLAVSQRLIVRQPSAESYMLHGLMLLGVNRFNESMDAFDHGLTFEAERTLESTLLMNRAMCRIQQRGDPARSLADWERALALRDEAEITSDNYFNLGVFHGLVGHKGPAAAAYRRSLELDPEHKPSYFNRSSVLAELGLLDEAEDMLAQIRQRDPLFPNLEFRQGMIYVARAEEAGSHAGIPAKVYYQRAVLAFDSHLELDPRDSGGYAVRGNCYGQLGEFDQAEADLQRALDYCSSTEQEAQLRRAFERLKRMRSVGKY